MNNYIKWYLFAHTRTIITIFLHNLIVNSKKELKKVNYRENTERHYRYSELFFSCSVKATES